VEMRSVVLIVDDEFLIRTMAADVINAAGFEAVEAPNADEAIRILESRPEVSVVLTDIEMPGSMDGVELACAIRRRWPCIEVVVTSGKWTPDADELPDRSRFMPKPYSPSDLTDLLHSLC
jgi:DNA-binding NtrC family response regulator